MRERWSLDELVAESQRYLEPAGESRRIQWQPNGRQIRYYATLGLLDKPGVASDGRSAWYGAKHLLQLLAIKRLQQDGLKLAEIQRALTGATTEKMRVLVGLPEGFLEDHDSVRAELPSRRDSEFWSTRPPSPRRVGPTFQHVWQLQFEPGVVLTIDPEQASRLSAAQRDSLGQALLDTWRNHLEQGK